MGSYIPGIIISLILFFHCCMSKQYVYQIFKKIIITLWEKMLTFLTLLLNKPYKY